MLGLKSTHASKMAHIFKKTGTGYDDELLELMLVPNGMPSVYQILH